MIDHHHVGLVANATPAHCLSELVSRGQLRFDLVVPIDDVSRPVDENRARNVFTFVLIACADILGMLPTLSEILGLDVAADVDDLKPRMGQPLG